MGRWHWAHTWEPTYTERVPAAGFSRAWVGLATACATVKEGPSETSRKTTIARVGSFRFIPCEPPVGTPGAVGCDHSGGSGVHRAKSEQELHPQLYFPGLAVVSRNHSKIAVLHVGVWVTEVDVVEDVEEVRLELQLFALRPQRGGLADREVPILQARTVGVARPRAA